MSMNQNMMSGSVTSGISSDNGTMMQSPGMSQQGQPGLQPNGVENSNSMKNMPLNQQTPNTRLSTYIKVWEGNLSGQREGQPVFITRLKGYRNSSASETLAANWPPAMHIVRLISQDHLNNRQYVGRADFLVFRAMNQHGFLGQLQEKKLCAVIQLPPQTLLLSFIDIADRLIGMLFPGNLVLFQPQISNQQQQLQAELQQQQIPQGANAAAADPPDATEEADPANATAAATNPANATAAATNPANATAAATNPANATTATNSTNAAATANGWHWYESSYIQGGGRSQLLSQGQVSSQGPPSISGVGGFMS